MMVWKGEPMVEARTGTGQEKVEAVTGTDGVLQGPPKRSGYLENGYTVKIDTGERKTTSILEQFEQAKQELEVLRKTIAILENELQSERDLKNSLDMECESYKEQLLATRQIILEIERLGEELQGIQKPYEETIEELTILLTKSQIKETKTKKELISLQIENLMKGKDEKSVKH
ncbi:MAG: hypothetical protein MRJ65_16280 [Candidatus Brocadiaceae bacterium]|nr:hypothetical protein [Candidatus Brocadiaceae bacterium]